MRIASLYAYSGGAWQDITEYSINEDINIVKKVSKQIIGNGVGSFINITFIDNSITQGYVPYNTSTQIKINIVDDGVTHTFTGYTDPTYKKLIYKSEDIVYREIITITNMEAMDNVNGHLGIGNINVPLPDQEIDWDALKGAAHSFLNNWEEHTLRKTQINGVDYFILDGGNATKRNPTGSVNTYNENGEYIAVSHLWDFTETKFFTQNGIVIYPPVYLSLSDYFDLVGGQFGYSINSNLGTYKTTNDESVSIMPTNPARDFKVKYAKTYIHAGDAATMHRIFFLDYAGRLMESIVTDTASTDYVFDSDYNWEKIYINGSDVILIYKTSTTVRVRVYTDIFRLTYTDYTYTCSGSRYLIHHDSANYNNYVGDTVFENGKIYFGVLQISSTTVSTFCLNFDTADNTFYENTGYGWQIISVGDGYSDMDYAYAISCLGGIAQEGADYPNSIVVFWYDFTKEIFRVGRCGSDTSEHTLIDGWSYVSLIDNAIIDGFPENIWYDRTEINRIYFKAGYWDISEGAVHLYNFGQMGLPKWEDIMNRWIFAIAINDGSYGTMSLSKIQLASLIMDSGDGWEAYTHRFSWYEVIGNYLWDEGYGDKYPCVVNGAAGEEEIIGLQYVDSRPTTTTYYTYYISANAYMVYSFIDSIKTSVLEMMNRLGAAFGFIWYIKDGVLYVKSTDGTSLGTIYKANDIKRSMTKASLSDYGTVEIGKYIEQPIYGKVLSFGDDLHHYGLIVKSADFIKSLIDGKYTVNFTTAEILDINPGEIWTTESSGDIFISKVKITLHGTEVEGIIL